MTRYLGLLKLMVLVTSYELVLSKKEEIRMPGAKPLTEDNYVCTSIPVTEEKYITQYEAIADAGTAHHILLFGCKQPAEKTSTWQCGATCDGESSIMFAWAKNAPPTKLPKGVGYHIGGKSNINYIVMQVHYAKAFKPSDKPDHSGIAFSTSKTVPKYTQGILLMASGYGRIPPHKATSSIDVSCRFGGRKTIHPFAYRTHAHSLSTVISAYRQPARKPSAPWEMLGKGNPQWPQAFYPMDKPHIIEPNDILVARCVYNSTGRDTTTRIGSTHKDEMCNFYMMYYIEGEAKFLSCDDNQLPGQARSMPADSLIRLPPNPKLDAMAMGHMGHHHHHAMSAAPTVAATEAKPTTGSTAPHTSTPSKDMVEAKDWYKAPVTVKMGQVGGVDVDSMGNVIIFHRGSHTWEGDSFDDHEVYTKQNDGAIPEKSLVQLSSAGAFKDAWGDNMFYLPHGITLDQHDNIWLTDVAMHQVFRYSAKDRTKPSHSLGEKFKPGKAEGSFCKPTDVAVKADGGFFVADGYCNGRIVAYDAKFQVVRTWGTESYNSKAPYRFSVVHSLALSPKLSLICAADREHRRIQCFNMEGKFQYEYSLGGNTFAIAFKPNSDKLVAVNADQRRDTGDLLLLQMNATGAAVMGHFSPASKTFAVLHDVAVSKDGKSAYLGQLNPPYVYKFTIDIEVPKSIDEVKKKFAGKDGHPAPAPHIHKPIVSTDEDVSRNNGGETAGSQTVPIIVAIMLIVPIVCVLAILLGFKLYNSHKRKGIHGAFDMGNIFGGRQRGDMSGFSPLTTQEDHYTDSEDDHLNDRTTFVKQ